MSNVRVSPDPDLTCSLVQLSPGSGPREVDESVHALLHESGSKVSHPRRWGGVLEANAAHVEGAGCAHGGEGTGGAVQHQAVCWRARRELISGAEIYSAIETMPKHRTSTQAGGGKYGLQQ